MSVTASSTTSGTATLENTSTGQTVTKTQTVSSEYTLCENSVEWIVEDFAECLNESCTEIELVPFADYGTIEFKDCSASGSNTALADAVEVVMTATSGATMSECTSSSSSVTCTWE
jgi:hypothetical protein